MMTNEELIMTTLKNMELRPELDSDGNIVVCYQMKNITFLVGENDQFVSVIFPQIRDISEGEDLLVMATCNKIVREIKFVKVYVDHTFKSVSAACEFYYNNDESLEMNIRKSLDILGFIRTVFRKDMMELSDSLK